MKLAIRLTVVVLCVVFIVLMKPTKPTVTPATTAATIAATPDLPIVDVTPKYSARLLVFTANWCTVCRQQKEIVDQIATLGVKVTYIDIDEKPGLAAEYNVTAVPTYIYYALGPHLPLTTHSATEVLQRVEGQ